MPTTLKNTFSPLLAAKISSGNASELELLLASYVPTPQPTFFRVVVFDVISDPEVCKINARVDYWEKVLGVSNKQYSRILPRNTIIGQRIMPEGGITKPMYIFPFFSSHLSLPCKSGEIVWAMYENPNANEKDIAYWLSRTVDPHFVDDVNHSHSIRQQDKGFSTGIREKVNNTDQPVYELQNYQMGQAVDGFRAPLDDTEPLISHKNFSPNDSELFEKLLVTPDASKLSVFESVPRYKKRPGDVVLEGSNNTLISLGTNRLGPVGIFPETGKAFMIEGSSKFSGCIDLVAGRGMTTSTGGIPVSTVDSFGNEIKKEIGKSGDDIVSQSEGNPDYSLDRSRVLISQNNNVDALFETLPYLNTEINLPNVDDDASSIAIKTDKIRLIARSDVSIIVTNFDKNAGEANSTSDFLSSKEMNEWASITITKDGNIVIAPSNKGLIKLGGDDADKAILCTDGPAQTIKDGQVKHPFILTEGADPVGNGKPGYGTFASKILVK